MKCSFVFVNYNNSQLTINCLNSIIKNNNYERIVIVDNNSNENEIEILNKFIDEYEYNDIIVIRNECNVGYFPGLNIGIKNIDVHLNDYVVIGNNDLVFNSSFFDEIRKLKCEKNVFVISPDIIKNNSIHQNPYLIKEYSLLRKIIYRLYYSNYVLAKLILLITDILNFQKSEKNRKNFDVEQYVNAGHGSCYILTKNYFDFFDQLPSESFLFGEEILLGNQVLSQNGKILYTPKLKVFHNEHSTMNKYSFLRTYKYQREAYKLCSKLKYLNQ